MPTKRNFWLVLFSISISLAACWGGWQYATQYEARLFALEARTGRVKWSKPIGITWTFTPGAGNGQVFAYSLVPIPKKQGDHSRKNTVKLHSFDAATGQQVWEYLVDPDQFDFSSRSIIVSPPVASGNWVVANFLENNLAVFDVKSGALQWHFTNAVAESRGQAFTLAGDRLITILVDPDVSHISLQALDAKSGAPIWKTNLTGASYFDVHIDRPAITANDHLVFVSNQKTVDAFDLQSGIFQFSIEADSSQIQAIGDLLYINIEASLLAVNAATGSPRWTFPVPQPFLFGMQTVGLVTYVIHSPWDQNPESGTWLIALNASDGHELWRHQLLGNINKSERLDQFFETFPAANQDAFFTTLEDENKNIAVIAFSAFDGTELWRFPLNRRDTFDRLDSPTTQGNLVFISDWAPRWRNLLTSLNW